MESIRPGFFDRGSNSYPGGLETADFGIFRQPIPRDPGSPSENGNGIVLHSYLVRIDLEFSTGAF